jgi:hypothetical protein
MPRLSRAAGHLLPALGFVALAIAWTFPLVANLSSSLPGEAGDNLNFLWNTWWMRQAVGDAGRDFFSSDRLFAPFGFDLTLHTHTALQSWVASTMLASLPVVAAHNVAILGSLALNGFAAYLLAWSLTGHRLASVVAGVIVAGSPYVDAHLLGHVNLIGLWGLPLFLWCLTRAMDRGSSLAAAGAGVSLVAIAYADYYYLVYAGVLAAAFAATAIGRVTWTASRAPLARGWSVLFWTLIAVALVAAAVIIVTGGGAGVILGVRYTATEPTNLLSAAWMLGLVWLLLTWRPRIRVIIESQEARRRLAPLWPLPLVAVAGLAPLLWRAWSLIARGDYAAPRASWRSGPAGIDLATLALGNPWHPGSGEGTRALYARLGIDAIEGGGWLGFAPLILVVWVVARHRRDPGVARWLAIGAAFFVWALGPWLCIAGFNTGLVLPQNVFDWIPVLSNARMPGRAMSVVYLAVGMLAAMALTRVTPARRPYVASLVLVLVIADFLPAPFPLTRIDMPPLYTRLRALPAGTVCELPVGVRDGFGVVGRFDDRVVSYQMTHGHPLVGGFAARVPDSIKRGYAEMPVVRSLFALSEGRSLDAADASLDPSRVKQHLQDAGIRYLVLNRETAPPALVAFVERSIPHRVELDEGPRSLLIVE